MSTPIQPFPLVQQGDQGHPVTTLQYLLRAHGHTIVVDGIFGPRTHAAVDTFQKSKSLGVDGIISLGSTGEAVRGVQEEFQFRNLSGVPSQGVRVDGIFGPLTNDAVRGFQQALGVVVDGIVGPVTWRALVSGMLSF